MAVVVEFRGRGDHREQAPVGSERYGPVCGLPQGCAEFATQAWRQHVAATLLPANVGAQGVNIDWRGNTHEVIRSSIRRRAITCAWISAAPSKMLRTRASHSTREIGYSSAKPLPPWICSAPSAADQAIRAARS